MACEVVNDINSELTSFYWVAKCYYLELKAEIEKTLHSRDDHAHAGHIYKYPQFFTPAERAWAVWTLSKTSFATKLDSSFGYDFSGGIAKRVNNAKDNFTEALCKRLEHVAIENRDGLRVIECYDNVDAFHFVDPPYINTNCGHYEGLFNQQAFTLLLDLLSNVKGKFMLTMFPNEEILAYATRHNWTIHKEERSISAGKNTRRRQEEWIVCNYTPLGKISV